MAYQLDSLKYMLKVSKPSIAQNAFGDELIFNALSEDKFLNKIFNSVNAVCEKNVEKSEMSFKIKLTWEEVSELIENSLKIEHGFGRFLKETAGNIYGLKCFSITQNKEIDVNTIFTEPFELYVDIDMAHDKYWLRLKTGDWAQTKEELQLTPLNHHSAFTGYYYGLLLNDFVQRWSLLSNNEVIMNIHCEIIEREQELNSFISNDNKELHSDSNNVFSHLNDMMNTFSKHFSEIKESVENNFNKENLKSDNEKILEWRDFEDTLEKIINKSSQSDKTMVEPKMQKTGCFEDVGIKGKEESSNTKEEKYTAKNLQDAIQEFLTKSEVEYQAAKAKIIEKHPEFLSKFQEEEQKLKELEIAINEKLENIVKKHKF